MSRILDAQNAAMVAKGAPSDVAEKASDFMGKYGTILIAFGALIGDIVVGVIIGLIGAAIFKKERSAYDPEPGVSEPTV